MDRRAHPGGADAGGGLARGPPRPTLAAQVNYGLDVPSANFMQQLGPLWSALLGNAAAHCPALYSPARVAQLRQAIAYIPAYWQRLAQHPKTLVHNDLNPRNTCFKRDADGRLAPLTTGNWPLTTYRSTM